MALSSNEKIDTNATRDVYDKYIHCEICNSVCIGVEIYLSINKERYHYATSVRCPKCGRVLRVDFIYDTNIPNKIDDNDIRERIRKQQMGCLNPCVNYELFEIKQGKLCTPRAGETFEQYKARYRKTRDDFYKEENVCQKQ